jgi:hypothetical protein
MLAKNATFIDLQRHKFYVKFSFSLILISISETCEDWSLLHTCTIEQLLMKCRQFQVSDTRCKFVPSSSIIRLYNKPPNIGHLNHSYKCTPWGSEKTIVCPHLKLPGSHLSVFVCQKYKNIVRSKCDASLCCVQSLYARGWYWNRPCHRDLKGTLNLIQRSLRHEF